MIRFPFRRMIASGVTLAVCLANAPARAQEPPPPPPADLQPVPAQPPPTPPPAAQAPPAQPPPAQPPPSYPQPVQAWPQPPVAGLPYPVSPPYYPYPPPGAYAAPPQPQPVEHEHVPAGNWYGWQSLIAVAPFDIAMFVGFARFGTTAGTGSFIAGFVGRSIAPGVVHLAHGRPTAAFGSVGLHAAATATGLVIGYAIGVATSTECAPTEPCRNDFYQVPKGPVYGAMAGSMVGTVLDVVFLAHRTPRRWTAASAEPSWTMAPFVTRTTAGLAAGGAF